MHKLLMLIFTMTVLAGCQVQWVSEYDEKTDAGVTQFQQAYNVFSYELMAKTTYPACSYSNFATTYAQLAADAMVIHTRAQAIPLNSHTVLQTDALVKNLLELRRTHQETDTDEECLSSSYIAQSSNLMNQVVRAILSLEIAKKRKYIKVTEAQNE